MGEQRESLAERARRLREESELTQQQVAKRSGLSQVTISDIERGRNKSTRDLLSLADALGVSPTYLASGKELRHQAREVEPPKHEVSKGAEAMMLAIMPHRPSAGAGSLPEGEDAVLGHLPLNRQWARTRLPQFTAEANLACLTALGDSMEPTIKNGDLLVVDRGVTSLKLDAVYVLAREDELFVKRVQRMLDGSLVIRSDNLNYTSQTINPKREKVRVLGRVLWVWNGRAL